MPKINAENEAKRQRRKEIAGILEGLDGNLPLLCAIRIHPTGNLIAH